MGSGEHLVSRDQHSSTSEAIQVQQSPLPRVVTDTGIITVDDARVTVTDSCGDSHQAGKDEHFHAVHWKKDFWQTLNFIDTFYMFWMGFFFTEYW